jgi:serine O-acetyltransferase
MVNLLGYLKADCARYASTLPVGAQPGLPKMLWTVVRSPGLGPVVLYRIDRWSRIRFAAHRRHPVRLLVRVVAVLGGMISAIFSKIQIAVPADIGPGLRLSNRGHIILGVRRMGRGCTVGHDVTVGMGRASGPPEIGDNVRIGSGSVVFGEITIGNDVVIEPGSVLSRTIPDGTRVGGNPARILKRGGSSPPPGPPSAPPLPSTAGPTAADSIGPPAARSAGPGAGAFGMVRSDVRRLLAIHEGPGSNWARRLYTLVFAYGLHATLVYRYGNWVERTLPQRAAAPARFLLLLPYFLLDGLVRVAYGIRIERHATIGPSFYVGHFGRVFVGRCRIGRCCSVHQQTRLESWAPGESGPETRLGDNVWVGAHAVVRPGVQLESGATVAAGAVVTSPLKARSLAVGDPARVVNRDYDNAGLLWG